MPTGFMKCSNDRKDDAIIRDTVLFRNVLRLIPRARISLENTSEATNQAPDEDI